MGVDEVVVSVVLPTYNRRGLLAEAVASVFAQRFEPWEFLIVDDGSTDDTPAFLHDLQHRNARVRPLFCEHCGVQSTLRNLAIRAARGRYIAFLDSDDLWMPNKLEVQIARLDSVAECRWSYSNYDCIDERGDAFTVPHLLRMPRHQGWILDKLIEAAVPVAMPSVVAERSLLLGAGGFDEEVVMAQDFDMWFRLAQRSPVQYVPEALVKVRRHPGNLSNQTAELVKWWLYICRKMQRNAIDPRIREICRKQIERRERELNDLLSKAQ